MIWAALVIYLVCNSHSEAAPFAQKSLPGTGTCAGSEPERAQSCGRKELVGYQCQLYNCRRLSAFCGDTIHIQGWQPDSRGPARSVEDG